ncbi:MAG: alanine racemase [Rhizobiales bacterium]|nr:alanine racemase [Hyphomicrobiales bacterium]MBI3673874.1 alanine racemase [Hyphomicrobiales bacterium]
MDIRDQFRFEAVGSRIEDLETPVPLIDIGIVERNLRRWQERCDKAKFVNRPHIKTHKLVPLARQQLALGASGITVQKLGEAEVMADAGIGDMLLTFNVVGRHKLERLAALARRTAIKVVADSAEVIEGLAEAGKAAGRSLSVLIECDTGAHRNGVQSPADALALAQRLDRTRGLRYGGLLTYPKTGARAQAAAFFSEARQLLQAAGLETEIVSTGGTPEMWRDDGLEPVNEYRAGTYVFNDRSLAERGACGFADCGLTVLATVVSRPAADRALIDAGSKSLTSDLLGLTGYGVVHDLGDARVYEVNEEHGYLDISQTAAKPRVGDLVRIVPNHVCPVMNLFDRVVVIDGNEVLGAVKVDARGMVQ